MTETTVNPEAQANAQRIAEISAKMAEGFAKSPDFLATPEGQALVDEMGALTGGKKKKAVADPKLVEEKEGIKAYLYGEGEEGDEGNGGAEAAMAEKLNAVLAEKFPLLAEKGARIEVSFKLKGAGKGAGTGTRTGAPRVLHREAGGKRSKALNEQGLPSVKALVEAYPDEAEEIQKVFGSSDNRRKLWEESGQDTHKVYVELSDGSKLCLQS